MSSEVLNALAGLLNIRIQSR